MTQSCLPAWHCTHHFPFRSRHAAARVVFLRLCSCASDCAFPSAWFGPIGFSTASTSQHERNHRRFALGLNATQHETDKPVSIGTARITCFRATSAGTTARSHMFRVASPTHSPDLGKGEKSPPRANRRRAFHFHARAQANLPDLSKCIPAVQDTLTFLCQSGLS